MVERVSRSGAWCGDVVAAPPDDVHDDDLLVDPFGGEIRLDALDLADCPSPEDDEQRALAGAHAERLVDEWWSDPVGAQQDWDADLAALYAQVTAEDLQVAVERRAALDGAPGQGSLAAALQVLDGATAYTPEQAAVSGFVDDLKDAGISAFAAAHRLTSYGLWLEIVATAQQLVAWSVRTPSLPRSTRSGRLVLDDDDALVDDVVANELALAAGVTFGVAGYRVDAAKALIIDDRLPATAALLEQGLLDWARLRAVLTRTADLTPDAARAVETLLYATRGVLDAGPRRFETALDAALLAVDEAAAQARRDRLRKGRRVSIQRTPDGSALFTATGPGEAITAAYNGLDAAARHLRANGDPRTLDQLRHDLFVTGCTSGYLPVPADLLPVPPGCVRTTGTTPAGASPTPTPAPAPAGDAAARPEGAGPVPAWFASEWPSVNVNVNVTVSAETLMGLVNHPGTLQGYGLIPADAIRDLVARGVFRCVVVDDAHGTVLGVGKSTFTPGYAPSDRLKLLMEHAFPECDIPGCGKASWRCDLDHQTPYAHGGATCQCNIRPLCRPHHRLKTAGLLVPHQRNDPEDPPGTTTWVTRTGRAYTALPHTPLPHTPLPHTPLPHTPLPHTPLPHTPLPHTPLPHTPLPHTPFPEPPSAAPSSRGGMRGRSASTGAADDPAPF